MGAVILRGARQAPGSTEEHPVVKLGSIRLGVTLLLRPPPPLVGLRGRFSVHGRCIPCMPPRSSDTPGFGWCYGLFRGSQALVSRGEVSFIFPLVSTPLPALAFQSLPDNSTPVDDHGLSVLFGAGRVSNKGSIRRLIWLMGNCFACRIPRSGSSSPTSILALLGTIERRSRAKAAVGAPQTSSQNPSSLETGSQEARIHV